MLLDDADPTYSAQTIQFAQQASKTDDMANRPVTYIEVKEMAPVKSHSQKVEILDVPPDYVVA